MKLLFLATEAWRNFTTKVIGTRKPEYCFIEINHSLLLISLWYQYSDENSGVYSLSTERKRKVNADSACSVRGLLSPSQILSQFLLVSPLLTCQVSIWLQFRSSKWLPCIFSSLLMRYTNPLLPVLLLLLYTLIISGCLTQGLIISFSFKDQAHMMPVLRMQLDFFVLCMFGW